MGKHQRESIKSSNEKSKFANTGKNRKTKFAGKAASSLKDLKKKLQSSTNGKSNKKSPTTLKFKNTSESVEGKKPDFDIVKLDGTKSTSKDANHSKRAKDGKKLSNYKGKKDGQNSNSQLSSKPLSYSAKKPFGKLVDQMKVYWNELRNHSTPKERKQDILNNMFKQITPHIADITLRHDVARIVQTIIQFGNSQQQELVLSQISAKFLDMSKSPYGHFVVLKAITYCTEKPAMKKIVSLLSNHFVSLGTHVIGARIVETILQLYPQPLTRNLKAEFYGKNLNILLPEPAKSLRELVSLLPNKKASIFDHMRDLIHKFVQKGLTTFAYVHHLLWEYAQELQDSFSKDSNPDELKSIQTKIDDFVALLIDSAPKLLSSKPGAKAMCFVITHSNAKDRKRIIKSLKGHSLESLLHDSAYLGIMRLIDVVDDTVNIQKSLFDEFKSIDQTIVYAANGEVTGRTDPPWIRIAEHSQAHRLIIRLFTPQIRHLEPDDDILFSVKSPASKKEDSLRRKEHIVYLQALLVKLFSMPRYTERLVRSRYGSKVLESIVHVLQPQRLQDSIARVFAGLQEDDSDQQNESAVGSAIKGNPSVGGEDDEEEEEEEEDDEDDVDGDDDDEEVGDDDSANDGNEEEEEVDEEEYKALLEDSKDDQKRKAKQPNQQQVETIDLLPIEEDPTAHVLLKKILRREAAIELHSSAADPKIVTMLQDYDSQQNESARLPLETTKSLDRSLFDTSSTDGIGHRLFEYLSTEEDTTLVEKWLKTNRGSFALHELLRIPSLYLKGKALLSGHSKFLSADLEGAKILAKLMSLEQSNPSKVSNKQKKEQPDKPKTKKAKV